MTTWKYLGVGWLDTWTSECGRCLITRHPQLHRGDHIIMINGELVATRDEITFAKWTAQNILEGRTDK